MFTLSDILLYLSVVFIIIGSVLDLAGRKRIGILSKRLCWVAGIYFVLASAVTQTTGSSSSGIFY